MAFNQGRNLRFDAFGYPASRRSPAHGSTAATHRAQGSRLGPVAGADPDRLRHDRRLERRRLGDRRAAASTRVVSYGYECTGIIVPLPCGNPEEGKLFGPYFGDVIQDLYRSQRRRRRR